MEKRAVGFIAEKLLAPGEALAAYFARVRIARMPVERVPLEDASGRILAEAACADDDYPNAPRSAMDGFAIAAEGAPGTFALAGELGMGTVFARRLAGGEALAIPTGGVLPDGADAVVPVEDARVDGARVHVDGAVVRGENVSPRASDMHRGDRVVEAGRRLAAPQLGVLATLGVVDVPVLRRPVVAILSSGDELVDPASVPRPGQIRDSNRYAIAASLRAMGTLPRHYATVSDDEGALERALRAALDECDAVVLTGGSSVGERDRTPAAVAALGAPGAIVHGLRVKPGKPTLLAAIGEKPVIGLPGNPLSALVILEAVAAPIVAALAGAAVARTAVGARLGTPAMGRKEWTWYVPVALQHEGGAVTAHPLALRSSSVSLAARADGYVVVDCEELPAGADVTVYRFLGS